MKYFLSGFPPFDKIKKEMRGLDFPEYREANGHIHTPYSFSAFSTMDTIFNMARSEKIALLGINDFYVSDGYDLFHKGCVDNRIFPLFNIEFIGLLREEQQKGIRINDPNNPGRIYFSGKGLDYPFHTGWLRRRELSKVIKESQNQIRAMITKLNQLIGATGSSLSLSYNEVQRRYARELVRERHLARAVKDFATEHYKSAEEQIKFLESLYGGKKSSAGLSAGASLENEIRSNLLKSGGPAFVPEDEKSFLELRKIIRIIMDAGGIPCYPVLLDDSAGNHTEFESDNERLFRSLNKLGIECIELIPGRNDHGILKKLCRFFPGEGIYNHFRHRTQYS